MIPASTSASIRPLSPTPLLSSERETSVYFYRIEKWPWPIRSGGNDTHGSVAGACYWYGPNRYGQWAIRRFQGETR